MSGQSATKVYSEILTEQTDALAEATDRADVESIIREIERMAKDRIEPPGFYTDRFFYRFTVVTLGIVLISSFAVQSIFAFHGIKVPEGIIALAAACVGALAGVLAPQAIR